RHTRCYRDWSSDVCSSDLSLAASTVAASRPPAWMDFPEEKSISRLVPNTIQNLVMISSIWFDRRHKEKRRDAIASHEPCQAGQQIGRTSSREKGKTTGVTT